MTAWLYAHPKLLFYLVQSMNVGWMWWFIRDICRTVRRRRVEDAIRRLQA